MTVWPHGSARGRAFTIIEVMIVMALVGIILLIIFLAVPAAQRGARNYDRKNYTSIITASLLEYYNNNGHYPGVVGAPGSAASDAEICSFLQSLPRVSPGTACSTSTASFTSINGTIAADCITITAGSYTICFQNWTAVDHGYIGPYDEISIMLAHWCNVGDNADPGQPVSYPIAGNDTDTRRFAVWTSLEGLQRPLCLDSVPSTIP